MSDVDPIIGNWYRDQETGSNFTVVALDEEAQTIEIQYFDGEVEELEMDAWYDQPIDVIEEPEDGSGPFDGLEAEDLGYETGEAKETLEEEEDFSDEDDLLAKRED